MIGSDGERGPSDLVAQIQNAALRRCLEPGLWLRWELGLWLSEGAKVPSLASRRQPPAQALRMPEVIVIMRAHCQRVGVRESST